MDLSWIAGTFAGYGSAEAWVTIIYHRFGDATSVWTELEYMRQIVAMLQVHRVLSSCILLLCFPCFC